jgi:hypothetical protein
MRLGVRALFALLLVGFVVQLVIAKVWPGQPYPGLFMPGFPASGVRAGTTTVRQPIITVTYNDGSTATFSGREVMAQSTTLPLAVFRKAFGPNSRSDPDTLAWLEHRLSDLGGGRQPVQAVVSWRQVVYDLDGQRAPQVTATERTVISLGGERG